MKALVLHGPSDLRYEEVPDPKIVDDRDIIVKVQRCGICGSDLHLFHDGDAHGGMSPDPHPFAIGHEAIGEVVERGSSVSGLKAGDRVLLSGLTGCGNCRSCLAGEFKRCEKDAWSIYGVDRGLGGCQAEAVRVPVGDFNALKIPDGVSDDQAILLTDALPTAYNACLNADIQPGRSVAIVGLGPIGLIAVELALIMGASTVYAIDPVAERRARAKELGATGVHPDDAIETIREETRGKMIDSVVEAVGKTATIDLAMSIVGANRTVSILGAGFFKIEVPFTAFMLGVTVRAEMTTPIMNFWPALVPMLQSGRIKPEKVVTEAVPLSGGVEAYKRCANRDEGVLKVMMTVD